MNRRYTIEEFEKGVKLLRKVYPNVALTTDVIVGFPGETEEEFKQTYEFLKKIKFYKMHIFKYSQRKGTRAAVMPNQIDGNVKEKRSRELIELSNQNEKEYNETYIGKEVEVLWEESHIENGKRYIKGHTTNYLVVKLETDENLENQIQKVKIIGLDGLELLGQKGHS
mgnify:CR=1 FL=1